MSSPQKTFFMDGVSMPAPRYEYNDYEGCEEDTDDVGDDGLLGYAGDADPYYEDQEEDCETGDGYQEIESGEASLQAVKADAPPAPMPISFYDEFDSFMSKPPPKFNAVSDGGKHGLARKKAEDVSLPRLGGAQVDGGSKGKPKNSVSSKIRSMVHTGRAIEATGVQGRNFDPALLQEAFAYAERLLNDIEDDDDGCPAERDMPTKSGSAPQLSKPHKSNNNNGSERKLNPYERQQQMRKPPKKSNSVKSGNQSREGVVKRLRSKTAIDDCDDAAFANISAAGLEHARSKSGLDYDALVQNFENGTTLNKLKAELAASRQSMAESENFMKQMSLEYSKKKKR